ncbi:MAG: isoleucine--tRNA ligase [Holosporales bacterium]|jgi:isoleucyl-tRNA synthetase|nr:isoleucine--tRNA ligase [Holosporales bacterium]
MSEQQGSTVQLKDTVFLPKTDFPMRGDLPKKDPAMINMWKDSNIFEKLRETSKGRKKFILHFGPPYANGPIHSGHALIGILKDAINKSYQMLGYDAPLVIGWDCHGLPIEWKIEERFLKQGRKRSEVPAAEFMAECRAFAAHWMEVQKEDFRKLGIIADFDNPYCTMHKETEAQICEQFFEIVKKGLVYRGQKPVMWSVVEKTVLAEAEVEYHDKVSDAIYVKYPITHSADNRKLEGAYVVIWTTTPWTIPGSMAIAYSPGIVYSLIDVNGTRLVIAEALVSKLVNDACLDEPKVISNFTGEALSGVICSHPLKQLGFEHDIPMLPGHHVTTDVGTGFVHTAPAHGVDDFEIGTKFGLQIRDIVNDDGTLASFIPHFAGEHAFKVGPHVIEELKKSGNLLHTEQITHSYPHSWRSKAPLIFRTTTQWFIAIDKVRDDLLEAIDTTVWFPEQYVNRIRSMVSQRPDWCISRQRLWGVPIALFIHKETGEILVDDEVFSRIAATFRTDGIESWRALPASHFLGEKYNVDDYVMIQDTLEVWFDSACSHHYVLKDRDYLDWPASLYFEGSDQHRGWFQSSLVESVCVTGKAPYKHVATNGFVLDKDGRKMSKSIGNVIAPDDVASKFGVDILRLWCLNSDYSQDMRLGDEILNRQKDVYRRFRNSLRYFLGVISDFNPSDAVSYDNMPELEKFVLARLYDLDVLLRQSIRSYDLQTFCSELHAFCSSELSAFYFDIRKDSVYCDDRNDVTHRACLTVMNEVFKCIVHWLAPIISFTAEEAWQSYPLNKQKTSIHLQTFPEIPGEWANGTIKEKWHSIQSIRKIITEAIEIERSAGVIGSSLEATVCLYSNGGDIAMLRSVKWDEIAIVSKAVVVHAQPPSGAYVNAGGNIGVTVKQASGAKCGRCWKIMDEVTKVDTKFGAVNLCRRCAGVVCGNS